MPTAVGSSVIPLLSLYVLLSLRSTKGKKPRKIVSRRGSRKKGKEERVKRNEK